MTVQNSWAKCVAGSNKVDLCAAPSIKITFASCCYLLSVQKQEPGISKNPLKFVSIDPVLKYMENIFF